MAWIELHQALPGHKKTYRAARCLGGVPRYHVVGLLSIFWLWALDNAPTGDITDLTAAEIADVTGWTGDPDVLMAAFTDAGFFDRQHDRLLIHDWPEYAGRLIARREAERDRSRERRQATEQPPQPPVGRRTAAQQPPDNRRTTGEQLAADRATTAGTVHDSTVQNRTVPNSTEPDSMQERARARDEPPEATTKGRVLVFAVPKPGLPVGSPHAALFRAFSAALGCAEPTTASERRKWSEPVAELVRAGVTADEIPALVAAYEDRRDVDCTPQGIANHLQQLRAPRRSRAKQAPKSWDALRQTHERAVHQEARA